MHAVVTRGNSETFAPQLEQMFRHRKVLFVDTLKWSVPVVDDVYEKDQFDTDSALYVLILDKPNGDHIGSVRLLPTTAPHILGALFPNLCRHSVPSNDSTWEITRLCCAPRQGSKRRTDIRHRIGIALAEFGLLFGISQYTCVAELGWLSQILAVGWECEPLGPPVRHEATQIGALLIKISPETLRLFWSQWGSYRTEIALDTVPLPAAA